MELLSTWLSSKHSVPQDCSNGLDCRERKFQSHKTVILNHLPVCIIQGNVPPGVPVVGCPKEGKERQRDRSLIELCVNQTLLTSLEAAGLVPRVDERWG